MMDVLYKIVFDISCYYACAAFFLQFMFDYEISPIGFGFLLGAILFAIVAERMPKLERVGGAVAAVIPAFALVWERTLPDIVILAIPWVYFVVSTFRHVYNLEYYHFKKMLAKILCAFMGPLLFLFFLHSGERAMVALRIAVPYLLVFLTASVMLLQILRYNAGAGDRKTFEAYQIKQTIAFFAFAVMVSVGNLVEIASNLLYRWIVRPIVYLIMSIAGTIIGGVAKNIPEYEIKKKILDESENFLEALEEAGVPQERPQILPEEQQIEYLEPMDYTPYIIAAGIIVAIILFVVLLGKRQSKRTIAEIEDEREELSTVKPPEKKLKKHSVHPDIVVRFHYREFMRKAETKKNRIMRSDTTEEIANKFLQKKPEEVEKSAEIKAIYRKTRYSGQETTREDAEKMKKLVKEV